jgi:double-stranded uracil-DNA glycosylase
MANCVSFEAVSRDDARVLILGTLPGAESLRRQQYYAKKENSFWRIMGELIGASPELPYEDRLSLLKERGVALWDVCASAERVGSLDSSIRSPVANDFPSFFRSHQRIELICFNGQPAERLFRRSAPAGLPAIRQLVLPSTSPAHARMRFEEKLSRWREGLRAFVD